MIAKHQPPACRSCGRPWTEHPGCQQLCADNIRLREELRQSSLEVAALRGELSAFVLHKKKG